jgi:hypothetical protein
MFKLIRAGCASLILFFMPQSLYAAVEDSSICDESIARAAQESTVPRAVLMKIARLESGREFNEKFVSWPWTLNNGGEGYFLTSKAEAYDLLKKLSNSGKTNVDVGCMQLNIKWHAKYFSNFSEMLSPAHNTLYAAKYLEQLYKETGSWMKAVKYYHSRNPKYNERYYAKFSNLPNFDNIAMIRTKPLRRPMIIPPPAPERVAEIPRVFSTSRVKSVLFWTAPQGPLVLTAQLALLKPAFTDLRKFKGKPLLMLDK